MGKGKENAYPLPKEVGIILRKEQTTNRRQMRPTTRAGAVLTTRSNRSSNWERISWRHAKAKSGGMPHGILSAGRGSVQNLVISWHRNWRCKERVGIPNRV
jgi:hypothetical protein